MRLYCDGKLYDLSLREWDSVSSSWSPDCFHDLETSVFDGEIVPRPYLDDLCSFWCNEAYAMTHHLQGDLADYRGSTHGFVSFLCEEVI